jgi:hypothetical protein
MLVSQALCARYPYDFFMNTLGDPYASIDRIAVAMMWMNGGGVWLFYWLWHQVV